jgi:tRNA threonylcarbamoyl adenosine modification protein (Sua5/YciO/YrdC/YwlC family)
VHDERVLDAAEAALRRGALIVYPTDTLYALGGRALAADVAAAVRRAKGRAADQALPVIVADLDQAQQIVTALPQSFFALSERFWPGPLTLVLPAAGIVPEEVTSRSGHVAIRIPALPFARELCRRAGPLIATSANRSGDAAATTCDEALRAVGRYIALAIDGGAATVSRASTVVDLTGASPLLLRAGVVEWDAVVNALAEGDPR